MERLTEVITDVFGETRVVLSEPSKNSICNGCLFPSECDRCSLYKAIKKLNDIENILGDEYDLDRLRELAQADREGRCVVMSCQPGDKISYKSGAGLLCNAVIDEYTPKNIFITAKTEIPNAEPLSQTFSISEVEAALRRKQDD